AWLIARRRPLPPGGWRLIARQWLIAFGIVMVLYLSGVLLGLFAHEPRPVGGSEPLDRLVARVGIWVALATLVTVLVVIQLLSVVLRRRRRRDENRIRSRAMSFEAAPLTLFR